MIVNIIKMAITMPIRIPFSQNSPIKPGGQMHSVEFIGCWNPSFKHGLFNVRSLSYVKLFSIKKIKKIHNMIIVIQSVIKVNRMKFKIYVHLNLYYNILYEK